MSTPLSSLTIAGFASIEALTLELTSDVTLLVGANGSGKSNIVGAFELLGQLLDGQLNDHVLTLGGFTNMLHRSSEPSRSAEAIELTAWGEAQGGLRNGYKARIEHAAGDRAIVSETTYFHDMNRYSSPMSDYLGRSSESQLQQDASQRARTRFVLELMSGCRVFHFDDTSIGAAPKRRSDMADNLGLHPDARNIASLLHGMKQNHRDSYDRIVRTVRTVAPFFGDFVLEPEGGTVLLRWKEKGVDGVFSADALSDGTLRFVCLTVLLLQPKPPSTIVLDEPELGLHPFAIHQLAQLLRRAGETRRIVAATQSVTLLGQFSVDEVGVVERTKAGTIVTRPDRSQLETWLEDYSLGELWEKNLLGGRPGPDQPVPAF